jgi:hypothetical protein
MGRPHSLFGLQQVFVEPLQHLLPKVRRAVRASARDRIKTRLSGPIQVVYALHSQGTIRRSQRGLVANKRTQASTSSSVGGPVTTRSAAPGTRNTT